MNRDAIERTRDALIDSTTYDQSVWAHECRTPGCIAGHAVFAHGYEFVPNFHGHMTRVRLPGGGIRFIENVAQEILGLDARQAARLFSSEAEGDPIAVLHHLLETGEVNWSTD